MTTFGDTDPEDAYDAGDPYGVRVAVLERVAAALRADPDRLDGRRRDALRLVAVLERERVGDDRVAAVRRVLEAL